MSDDDGFNDDVGCTWSCGEVCEDIARVFRNNTPLKCGCCIGWSVIVLILAIILIACSVETIDSTEMGIAYNAPQAILSEDVKEEGLHGKPPFGYYIIWPRTHETMSQEVTGMSKDGVIVSVTVAFQYKVEETAVKRLTKDYQDYGNYKENLRLKSRSGIRNACMEFKAQEFQTKRAAVQTQMFERVKQRLDGGNMNAFVLDLQLTKVDRPTLYEAAVDEKENARNAIDLVKNLRSQKITQANTNLKRVRVQANKTLDTAYTQAAVVAKNAEADGSIVYGRYASQGALYKKVRQERGLSSEGLLAYIGTRLVDELDAITVGLSAPARIAYGVNTTTRL